jgi:1-acyl-sn-glycerol-3-phosphate acyltransferase
VLITTLVFPFIDAGARLARVQYWSRRLLAIVNVELTVSGELPSDSAHPVLILSNHVSWLDIFVINATCPLRFIAKDEIRHWPVIGWLSTRTGSVYIRRTRRHDARRVNQHLTQAFAAGERFAVFPEGTTTDGTWVMPFHASLLAPALHAQASLYPAALRFTRSDGSICVEAGYEGDKTLLQSLLGILRQPMIRAQLALLPPLVTEGKTRRELAHKAEQIIARTLRLPVARTKPETPYGPPASPPTVRAPTRSPSLSTADPGAAAGPTRPNGRR